LNLTEVEQKVELTLSLFSRNLAFNSINDIYITSIYNSLAFYILYKT